MANGKLKVQFVLLVSLMLLAVGCSSESASVKTQDSQNKNAASGETEDFQNKADVKTEQTETAKSSTPKQGGELAIGYYSDASSWDPIFATSGGDTALQYLMYDTLVNYGPNFEALPGLAKSWEQKDDKTLILHLQEGVKFHDGTPFDAEAVKFNIERANSDKSALPDLQGIDSVEVIDSLTVALHLKKPDSGLLLTFTTRAGMMVSPTAVKKYSEDFASHPVGTGPFKLVKRVPNSEIQFERFNEYWQKGKPYLDKITVKVMLQETTMINALRSGEVQVIAPISVANLQVLKQTPNITVDASPSLNFQDIYVNTAMPPLDKKEVRLAIQYSLNREPLVQAIQFGEGEPAYGPFPKGHPAYDPDAAIPYDPEKAKQLIKEAGVENVTLDLVLKPDAFSMRVGEAVKGQLAQVGIKVNLLPTEVTKMVQLMYSEKKYPANIGRSSGNPDPINYLRLNYSQPSYYNPGKHLNPELEALLDKAAASTDEKERMELAKEATRMAIKEDAVRFPLFFEPMIVGMDKKVNGYVPHLMGKPRFQFLWLDE